MADPVPAGVRGRGRIPLSWAVRLAGSALVLAVLFVFVPFGEVVAAARQLPAWLWAAALAGFLAGHMAAAAKWRLLIGPGVSFAQAFRAHLAGLAANLCLPGVAGGDVVRAGMVYKASRDRAQLAVGSVVDRLLDTLGLAVIAAASGIVAFGASGSSLTTSLLMLAGLALAAIVAAFLLGPPLVMALSRAVPKGKIGRLLAKAAEVGAQMARRPGRLVLCLAISMLIQSAFIGINLAFAAAARMDTPAVAWAFAWATAKIIAIAPISLGGLGAREASMAALLAPFGAEPAKVVAVSLLWQTVLYASGALGGLAQIFWKGASPDPAPDAALVERSQ